MSLEAYERSPRSLSTNCEKSVKSCCRRGATLHPATHPGLCHGHSAGSGLVLRPGHGNLQIPYMQIATWNDYEEGTEIETGVDSCWRFNSPQVSSQTLNWTRQQQFWSRHRRDRIQQQRRCGIRLLVAVVAEIARQRSTCGDTRIFSPIPKRGLGEWARTCGTS
jgi:hypothetical protein